MEIQKSRAPQETESEFGKTRYTENKKTFTFEMIIYKLNKYYTLDLIRLIFSIKEN